VRNLAQRSAEAAKNTANLIEGSQKNSERGVAVAGEVGGSLGQIKETIQKVSSLVSEIAAASNEQAKGIEQVNTAVSEMDKVTQQNASTSEQAASAAEELSAQAAELASVVGELMAIVGGSQAKKQRETVAKRTSSAKYGHMADRGAPFSLAQHPQRRKLGGHPSASHPAATPHAAKPDAKNISSEKASQVIPLDDDDFKDF